MSGSLREDCRHVNYPIVLKDKFRIIAFACLPTYATFDSVRAPGPMKVGRGWSTNGPIRRADSAKTLWQSMPATRWMESYSFVPSASTTPSIVRPVRRNLRTMRNKSQKISASVLRSGKRSRSRPLQIFPATEPKLGNPIHDFLMPVCFETWYGHRHTRAWDRNLVHSFLNFNAGAWSLPPFLTRWTDFSTHCHEDHSTQQKSATPRLLDHGI